MAYFRCGQGAGGNELKILITTTDTSLYGQTITISKDGSTVGTTTFDNTGNAEYTVDEVGQYTVSCGGYSATVDVSNEFPVEILTNIVATVTLYSAANDTVTFTDATGQKTANTDTNGVATNVVITVSRDTPTVLFTSGVAKNPDDLTEYYSKSVTITDSTAEVYVMPDDTLYWFGYVDSRLETCNTANGWTANSGYSLANPTYDTFGITMTTTAVQTCGVGTKQVIPNPHTMSIIAEGITGSNGYGFIMDNPSKVFTWNSETKVASSPIAKWSRVISASNYYGIVFAHYGRAMKVYAIWLE